MGALQLKRLEDRHMPSRAFGRAAAGDESPGHISKSRLCRRRVAALADPAHASQQQRPSVISSPAFNIADCNCFPVRERRGAIDSVAQGQASVHVTGRFQIATVESVTNASYRNCGDACSEFGRTNESGPRFALFVVRARTAPRVEGSMPSRTSA